MAKTPRRPAPLPTKAQVLEFIKNSPGVVGRRELARAFNLTADQRPFLRKILKDISGESGLKRSRSRPVTGLGVLPDVAVIEATGVDDDGELLGRPLTWTEDTPPPRILILPVPAGQAAVAVGDRLLCQLTPAAVEDGESPSYLARLIRRLVAGPARSIGRRWLTAGPGGKARPARILAGRWPKSQTRRFG